MTTISGAALFKSKKRVVFGFAANVDAAATRQNTTPARRATRENQNAEKTRGKLRMKKRSDLEEVCTGYCGDAEQKVTLAASLYADAIPGSVGGGRDFAVAFWKAFVYKASRAIGSG